MAGCSLIHCLAASSGDMFLLVIRSATSFWSAFFQLKFLMKVAAAPPVVYQAVRTILLRV